jgi:hypothetical protein
MEAQEGAFDLIDDNFILMLNAGAPALELVT